MKRTCLSSVITSSMSPTPPVSVPYILHPAPPLCVGAVNTAGAMRVDVMQRSMPTGRLLPRGRGGQRHV